MQKLIYLDPVLLNLSTYTINVFGAGGTGSHLIDKLAVVTYALRETKKKDIELTVYDFDKVSVRNAGRSDFIWGDRNIDKAMLTISKANLAYGLDWKARTTFMPVKPAHFNFICTDTNDSRIEYIKQITAMCGLYDHDRQNDGNIDRDKQPYYIFDIGNDKDFGQIVLLDTQEGKLKDIDRTGITSETIGTQSCGERSLFDEQGLFINQFMALTTAEMFWQFLSTLNLDYSQVYINLSLMKINTKLEFR